jgi:hypothetical protein
MKGETMKIPKQAYTPDFKELVVTRVKDGLTAEAAVNESNRYGTGSRQQRQTGATVLESRWPDRSRWNCHDCVPRTCN